MIGLITAYANIVESIGDDVLFASENGIKFYLDDFEYYTGKRIVTFSQVIRELVFTYRYWSGRILGYAIAYGGWVFPNILRSFITAFTLVSNCFLLVKIATKCTFLQTINHSLLIVFLFLSLYWWPIGTYYTYMWTFISEYQIPLFIGLLYYDYRFNNPNHKKIYIFIIGFLLGISHEIITLCFILLFTLKTILDCRINQKYKVLLSNYPVYIGYLICFFAPGNFHRTTNKHDIISETYAERLKKCWDWHWEILTGSDWSKISIYVFLCLICLSISVVMVVAITKKRKILLPIMDGLCFFMTGLVFIPVWALMPRITLYGLCFWMGGIYLSLVNVLVCFIKQINCKMINDIVIDSLVTMLTVGLLTSCFILNYTEIKAVYKVANTRKQLAQQAKDNGITEINVPRYPITISNERYLIEYLNNQHNYDESYYINFWDCHLIIEEDGS